MEDLTGKQLGPYQVVAPVGEGGMAAVYKAYQPGMDRYVALKILPRHFASDPNFAGRFTQEAKVLAKLQHPHILPVFDFGEADGYTYIVMPFVQSGTLVDLLKGRPLALKQVRSIASQVGDALDYAHSQGLIHRDVKPSNVLVDSRGNCLLTDFGIAKIVESSAKFTSTGGIIGTPAYMSPEQGLGHTLDKRSDIYSLGVMLYEMATGRPPYDAETPMAIVVKHIHDPLPMPRAINPSLPESVERVILKALAKRPEDRYATAGDMVEALETATSTLTAPATPTPAIPTAPGAELTITDAPLLPPPPVKPPTPVPPPATRKSPWGMIGIGTIALATVVCLGVAAIWGANLIFGGGSVASPPTSIPIPPTAVPPTATRPVVAPTDTSHPVVASVGTIKVVSDLPMTGSSFGQTQTIVNAISMAFDERKYTVCNGAWTIQYEAHDHASAALGKWDPDVVTANAKAYAADPSIGAVIGTFNSNAAKLEIPILNPENLVMISPSNTLPGLTKPGKGEADEPYKYYPNGMRNYSRVVPADDVQGAAGARWAQNLGAKSVYILDDQELYGQSVAVTFQQTAKEIGLNVLGHEFIDGTAANYKTLAAKIKNLGPDLIYFGGITQNNAGQLWKDIRNAGYTGMLMGPDGIYEDAFLSAAGDAAEGTYITFGAVPPSELTGKAGEWRYAYKTKFGADPEMYTVYGYVAATMLMDAFERVCASGGSLLDRAMVRDAVFSTKDFDSVIGRFSIDPYGDTTLALMSGSRVRNGRFEFITLLGER